MRHPTDEPFLPQEDQLSLLRREIGEMRTALEHLERPTMYVPGVKLVCFPGTHRHRPAGAPPLYVAPGCTNMQGIQTDSPAYQIILRTCGAGERLRLWFEDPCGYHGPEYYFELDD